ncbi:hypothetical protein [Liberiplasma polymorphum]|uniref:hypothetical protein n=1 Tax=Liberiplasma polymorphum TaxID=3374570 RepID=UPI003770A0AC
MGEKSQRKIQILPIMVAIFAASINAILTQNIYLVVAVIIILTIAFSVYNFYISKRLSKGISAESTALKSSQYFNDYLRKINQYISDNKFEENEDVIADEIGSITRSLLLLGEYKIRLTLGKKMVNHSKNSIRRISFLIDEVGWTLVLMGKNEAYDKLLEAITMIGVKVRPINDQFSVEYHDDSDEGLRKLLLSIRAYRHISSIPTIDLAKCLDAAYKAEAIYNYIINVPNINKLFNQSKQDSMLAGIYYSIGEIFEKKYEKDKDNFARKVHAYNYLSNALDFTTKTIELSKDFDNHHRFFKTILLKNSILDKYLNILDKNDFLSCIEEEHKDLFKDITSKEILDNLDMAEQLLNDAIYVDEALEKFLKQKIQVVGE